ncbi:hypothetical protein WA026_015168 [Henosepilachna vigintioctopunctata]|uniref:Coiled-coil domain-containing protein 13 n=1 Tax=Henosepilachna vigintioctopunctata TaxID=420089 RepID=A0AAW1TTH8_9CUCU
MDSDSSLNTNKDIRFPEIPKDIVFPDELNRYLRQQLEHLTHENCMLRKHLKEEELRYEKCSSEVETLELKLKEYEKFDNKHQFASATTIASAKIVELSKRLREKNSEVESLKTKCSKLEKKIIELQDSKVKELTENKNLCVPPTPSSHLENEDQLKNLQDKLSVASMKLREIQNTNIQLKTELKVANKYLQQEVGDNLETISNNSTQGWRGRAQIICDLQQKNHELKEKLKNYQQKNNKESIKPLDKKINDLNKENDDLKNALNEQKRRIEVLKARCRVLETDQTINKSKITSLTNQTERDQTVLKTLTNQVTNQQDALYDTIKQKDKYIRGIQQDNEILRIELSKQRVIVENLTKNLNDKMEEIKELMRSRRKSPRPSSTYGQRSKNPTDEKLINRLEVEKSRLLELTEIQSTRITSEREAHAKTQNCLRLERQRAAKLETSLAKLELEVSSIRTGGSYCALSTNRSVDQKINLNDLKAELELAQETVKALKTSLYNRNANKLTEKEMVLKAIEQSKCLINTKSFGTLEGQLMCHIIPCIKKIFLEVCDENSKMNSVELSQTLSDNLKILINLTDFVGIVLELVSLHANSASISSIRVIFLELPSCFQAIYKHCKESQKKYQTLMEDCSDILELYRKNQDLHMKFLDILNSISIDSGNQDDVRILIQVLQSILNIMEVLCGMNIKALTDTWKIYIGIVEKYREILIFESVYCVQEIQILIQQINTFMSSALENEQIDSRKIQYIKLSGFLLKVGIKIMSCFWDHLQLNVFEVLHSFLCTIYNYSLEFLAKWNVKVDIQHCIQSNLLAVVTTFIADKVLSEIFLMQLLANVDNLTKIGPGCMILDLKIMKFLLSQPFSKIDYLSFSCYVNHIFADIAEYSLFICESFIKTEDCFFTNLCMTISDCIEIHNNFYDDKMECSLFSNIVGNNLWCHLLASDIWIRLLCIATEDSRRDVVEQLVYAIDKLEIDVLLSFPKAVLLSRFMEKVFNILNEDDISDILKIYPPADHFSLWSIVTFSSVSVNQKKWIDPLISSLLSKLNEFDCIQSIDEMIHTVKILKLISTINFSFLDSDGDKLLSNIVKLWGFQYEKINMENNFLKFFISNLAIATTGYIKHFSENQIYCILEKMKTLSSTIYFKFQLSDLLNAISSRTPKHGNEQNRLNFLISDIFEILFTEGDELLKKLSLEAFLQFSENNHYIIINNVSRLLPNMNLELHLLKKDDDQYSNERLKKLEIIHLEHNCLKENPSKAGSKFSKNDSVLAQSNKAPVYHVPTTSKKTALGYSRGLRCVQNKRMKLNDDVQAEDDSISEVLHRIKSEIKCLKIVLVKDSLTRKNAQDIRMLIDQLQNILLPH